MKIRVTFFSSSLTAAAVHVEPGWLARLFGADDKDDIAHRHRDGWCWDSTDLQITDRRILAALDRQLTIDTAVRRFESALRQ